MSDSIQIDCTRCSSSVRVPRSRVADMPRCPACKHLLILPSHNARQLADRVDGDFVLIACATCAAAVRIKKASLDAKPICPTCRDPLLSPPVSWPEPPSDKRTTAMLAGWLLIPALVLGIIWDVSGNEAQLLSAVLSTSSAQVQSIIESGMDINAKLEDGRTALQYNVEASLTFRAIGIETPSRLPWRLDSIPKGVFAKEDRALPAFQTLLKFFFAGSTAHIGAIDSASPTLFYFNPVTDTVLITTWAGIKDGSLVPKRACFVPGEAFRGSSPVPPVGKPHWSIEGNAIEQLARLAQRTHVDLGSWTENDSAGSLGRLCREDNERIAEARMSWSVVSLELLAASQRDTWIKGSRFDELKPLAAAHGKRGRDVLFLAHPETGQIYGAIGNQSQGLTSFFRLKTLQEER